MNLVNVGSYLCDENVLMERNFADTLIKHLDNLFIMSKLKGGYYEWDFSWDVKLQKEEISLKFYEVSKHSDIYEGEFYGMNLLAELGFYIDGKDFCDTIKLFANRQELLNYGFNSEKEKNRINFESTLIKNEKDLKRALDFVINKI